MRAHCFSGFPTGKKLDFEHWQTADIAYKNISAERVAPRRLLIFILITFRRLNPRSGGAHETPKTGLKPV